MVVNPMGARFEEYWSASIGVPRTERMPYAIRRLSDGRVVGTSAYVMASAKHGGVEIGGTFLNPDVRAGAVNPESKILMLGHAFESGAVRVQFKIDSRNTRSQAARRCQRRGATARHPNLDRAYPRHRRVLDPR